MLGQIKSPPSSSSWVWQQPKYKNLASTEAFSLFPSLSRIFSLVGPLRIWQLALQTCRERVLARPLLLTMRDIWLSGTLKPLRQRVVFHDTLQQWVSWGGRALWERGDQANIHCTKCPPATPFSKYTELKTRNFSISACGEILQLNYIEEKEKVQVWNGLLVITTWGTSP